MRGLRLSNTVEPDTVADVTVTRLPSARTSNIPVVAVVAFNASLYVSVILSPTVLVVALPNTGAVISVVELFVTVVVERPRASLPKRFWMALFVVASDAVGAVYLTVTTCPIPIVGVIESETVDPLT